MKCLHHHMPGVFVFGIMALLTMGARPQKYLICHKTKGKTYKMMTVPSPALKGHLAHGDHMWQEEHHPEICEDGLDNDCDGLVDMDEPACPYAACEARCYTAWAECDDPCWFDPDGFIACNWPHGFLCPCKPECLEALEACERPCNMDYDTCVTECPDRQ